MKQAYCTIITKKNFEEILQVSDGVMIMRQSLALELPQDKAFIAQKWMIQ